ncbi:hypothetical protein F5Y16DRAFT_121019 [Xylariaceae sp. FL0255]|nr:hypothetical protein F5Y16DRAFT_121019 [Xylariaceae sp. FL0255]
MMYNSIQIDDTDPRIRFGLSCPSGGDFYICQNSTTRFLGCCGVNPCNDNLDGTCPTGKLFAASFSAASGVDFVAQGCAATENADAIDRVVVSPRARTGVLGSWSRIHERNDNTAELSPAWYTCSDAIPPFLGCCTNNPCNNGCSFGNLIPAVLSEDAKNASQFLIPTTTSSAGPTGTSVLPKVTTGTSATSTPTSQAASGSKVQPGLVVGLVIVGVVILLAVIGVYLWVKKREERRQEVERKGTRAGANEIPRDASGGFQEVLQGDLKYTLSPMSGVSPYGKGGDFFSNNNRSNAPPRIPEDSDQYINPRALEIGSYFKYSPDLSRVFELEGSSSSVLSTLYPKASDAYRGFDGRDGA